MDVQGQYQEVKRDFTGLLKSLSQGKEVNFEGIHGKIKPLLAGKKIDPRVLFLDRQVTSLQRNQKMLQAMCAFNQSLNDRVTIESLGSKIDKLQRLQSTHSKASLFLEGIKKRLARQVRRATQRSFWEWITRSMSTEKTYLRNIAFFNKDAVLAGMERGPRYVMCFKRWFLNRRVDNLATRVLQLSAQTGDLEASIEKGDEIPNVVERYTALRNQSISLKEHFQSFLDLGALSSKLLESSFIFDVVTEQFAKMPKDQDVDDGGQKKDLCQTIREKNRLQAKHRLSCIDFKRGHVEKKDEPRKSSKEMRKQAEKKRKQAEKKRKQAEKIRKLRQKCELTEAERAFKAAILGSKTVTELRQHLTDGRELKIIFRKDFAFFATRRQDAVNYWEELLKLDTLFFDFRLNWPKEVTKTKKRGQKPIESWSEYKDFVKRRANFFGEKGLEPKASRIFVEILQTEDVFFEKLSGLESKIKSIQGKSIELYLAKLRNFKMLAEKLKDKLQINIQTKKEAKGVKFNERRVVHRLSVIYRSIEFREFISFAKFLIEKSAECKAILKENGRYYVNANSPEIIMQRIMRIPMLLKRLHKNVSEESKIVLHETIGVVEGLVREVNDLAKLKKK